MFEINLNLNLVINWFILLSNQLVLFHYQISLKVKFHQIVLWCRKTRELHSKSTPTSLLSTFQSSTDMHQDYTDKIYVVHANKMYMQIYSLVIYNLMTQNKYEARKYIMLFYRMCSTFELCPTFLKAHPRVGIHEPLGNSGIQFINIKKK